MTCEASTITDLITCSPKKEDDSYIKTLEMQIQNQIETIVAKEEELNRLKRQLMNRKKYGDFGVPSLSKSAEKDYEIQELFDTVCAAENVCKDHEAKYWRNIAFRLNCELKNLQSDANTLVNILTQLQYQHQK
ncbi:unnamed protein product [Heterobilharzia americana]|nr:unnamed protein product [Heterobilharzia americana]